MFTTSTFILYPSSFFLFSLVSYVYRAGGYVTSRTSCPWSRYIRNAEPLLGLPRGQTMLEVGSKAHDSVILDASFSNCLFDPLEGVVKLNRHDAYSRVVGKCSTKHATILYYVRVMITNYQAHDQDVYKT